MESSVPKNVQNVYYFDRFNFFCSRLIWSREPKNELWYRHEPPCIHVLALFLKNGHFFVTNIAFPIGLKIMGVIFLYGLQRFGTKNINFITIKKRKWFVLLKFNISFNGPIYIFRNIMVLIMTNNSVKLKYISKGTTKQLL